MSHVKLVVTCSLVLLAVLVAIGGWNHAQRDVAAQDVAWIEPGTDPVLSEPVDDVVIASELHDVRSELSSASPTEVPVTASVSVEAAPKLPEGSLDARLIDEQGNPLPGAEVMILRLAGKRGDPRVLAQGRADTNGIARVSVELPRYAVQEGGAAAAANFELLARYPMRATHRQAVTVHGDRVTHLGDVILGPGAQLTGRVVNQRGVAVAGARVGALAASELVTLGPDQLDQIARVGSDHFDFLTAETSRTDGAFELVGLPPGLKRVWAHAPGLRFGLSDAVDLRPGEELVEVEIVLNDFQRTDRVAGQVVGPDGVGRRAWLGRMIRAGERSTGDSISTDAEGRFSFEVEYLDAIYDLSATDPQQEFARVQVRDIRPGDQDVVIAFRQGEPMLIHLRDPMGEPVVDASISIGIDGRYSRTRTQSTKSGDYAIERPTGRFALEANAPGFRELFAGRFDDATAPAELNLVMERALTVQGVVVAGGAPVASAVVEAFEFDPGASMTVNGLRCPISFFESGETRTDAEGRFSLDVDVDGEFVVRARHGDWVPAELGPFSADSTSLPVELELSRGGTIEGVVRVDVDASPGGIVVAIHRGDGRPRSTRTAPDGSFRFEKLMAGQWQVFSLEEDVNPHGGTYSSYQGGEPLEWDCSVQLGRTTKFDLDLTSR